MSKSIVSLIVCLLAFLMSSGHAVAVSVVHHDLNVSLNPVQGVVTVQDNVTLPEKSASFEFILHGDLSIQPDTSYSLRTIERWQSDVPVTLYRLTLKSEQNSITLNYSGKINHVPRTASSDYAGQDQWSPAIISDEGVFLSGTSLWYPDMGDYLHTFNMQVDLPDGWHAVSQGLAIPGKNNSWRENIPQEEIYLVAGRYHVYEKPGRTALAQVFLRAPDQALAEQYLSVTEKYIDMYGSMLGEYPYGKFALVENFLQTGYGMPSFTLLGSRVIRLPFIPYTSYPHEILHNWWGNGVYIDFAGGNWAEGLTSYLADHLLKEQRGQGASYRRDALQKYADYVSEQKEFPLIEFRGRHSQASQAIGYGKVMMFFHQLRQQLGDKAFIDGLRRFYRDNRFTAAGYQQLQKAFEQVSEKDLSSVFDQWLMRTGAPELEITAASVTAEKDKYELSLQLIQQQADDAFMLSIPVWIKTSSDTNPLMKRIQMTSKKQVFNFSLDSQPLALAVDPQFDVFRRLHDSEIPSSMGQLFAADNVLIVLSSGEEQKMTEAYTRLATDWTANHPDSSIVRDDRIGQLPEDRMVWLFGQHNRFVGQLASLADSNQLSINDDSLYVGGNDYDLKTHSYAITISSAGKPAATSRQTTGWLSADSVASLTGMARKLPHYGKYSFVIFRGEQPVNVLKGQWDTSESALRLTLSGQPSQTEMRLPLARALSELSSE